MIVLILEKVPLSLRGELSRWLLEPKSGIFVGKVSALVREKLWEMVNEQLRPQSGAILIHSAANEQGFQILMRGDTSRVLHTIDGLQLIRRPYPNPQKCFQKLYASISGFKALQKAKEANLPDVEI